MPFDACLFIAPRLLPDSPASALPCCLSPSMAMTCAMHHHACLAKAYSAKGEWRPYVARAFAGAAALDAPASEPAYDIASSPCPHASIPPPPIFG